MTTIVISIHPGMVAKSEINTGMYSKHGHYYMLIDKDLTPYMDELESIDGLDRIKFDIYNNIRLEACKETSFYLQSCNRESYEQLNLFIDYSKTDEMKKENKNKLEKEKKIQQTVINIKNKFGKNSVLKGMNYEEGTTTKERNKQIGGHKA